MRQAFIGLIGAAAILCASRPHCTDRQGHPRTRFRGAPGQRARAEDCLEAGIVRASLDAQPRPSKGTLHLTRDLALPINEEPTRCVSPSSRCRGSDNVRHAWETAS